MAFGNRSRGPKMKVISVAELQDKLAKEKELQEDFEVRGKDVLFNKDGTVSVKGAVDPKTQQLFKFSMNKWAFTQFCNRLEIPTEFLRRSPVGDHPAGKKAIVDYWKEAHDGAAFFIRTRRLEERDKETGATHIVRGFLTTRFSPFDNLELLNMTEPMILKNKMEVQMGHTDDTSFHLRLLFPDTTNLGTTNQPDGHKVGMHVVNSEVGYKNCTGDFLVYRMVCTNGIIAVHDKSHLFNHRHVNLERHEVRASILHGIERVEKGAGDLIAQVKETREVELASPIIWLERTLKSNKATDDFIDAAKSCFEEEPGNHKFAAIQAITRASQRFGIDQRVAMEELAGRLMIQG